MIYMPDALRAIVETDARSGRAPYGAYFVQPGRDEFFAPSVGRSDRTSSPGIRDPLRARFSPEDRRYVARMRWMTRAPGRIGVGGRSTTSSRWRTICCGTCGRNTPGSSSGDLSVSGRGLFRNSAGRSVLCSSGGRERPAPRGTGRWLGSPAGRRTTHSTGPRA